MIYIYKDEEELSIDGHAKAGDNAEDNGEYKEACAAITALTQGIEINLSRPYWYIKAPGQFIIRLDALEEADREMVDLFFNAMIYVRSGYSEYIKIISEN